MTPRRSGEAALWDADHGLAGDSRTPVPLRLSFLAQVVVFPVGRRGVVFHSLKSGETTVEHGAACRLPTPCPWGWQSGAVSNPRVFCNR